MSATPQTAAGPEPDQAVTELGQEVTLCGVALYLMGLLAAGWRLSGTLDALKLVAALVLLAVGIWAPAIAAWSAAAIVTGVLAAVCAADAVPVRVRR